MYRLKYKRKSKNQIIKFIDFYKNNFLETFTDTGLFYESIIRQNYIDNARKFKLDIREKIEENLVLDKIFGYSVLKNNNFEITIKVGNYRLFIEYTENIKDKIRIIEDIKFNKK